MGSQRCPQCGGSEVEPVVYVLRTWRVDRDAILAYVRSGEVPEPPPVDEASPNFQCSACGHSWPDPSRIEAVREIREHFTALRSSLGL